jgi:hypothetical protein
MGTEKFMTIENIFRNGCERPEANETHCLVFMSTDEKQAIYDQYQARFRDLDEIYNPAPAWEPAWFDCLKQAAANGVELTRESVRAKLEVASEECLPGDFGAHQDDDV